MDLEMRHLRLVAALAQHRSLTRAGGDLHLTQSALSHQLVGLERKLGVTLFHRHGKKMLPTAAGLRLIDTARRTLAAVQRTEEDLRRWADGQSGVVRLATECYTSYYWLPRVLDGFRERFPQVDVQMVAEATRHPIRALLAGRLDLAITTGAETSSRLVARPLFRDEVVVVVPAKHPLAERPYVRAEDFATEHLIMYAVPRAESSLFLKVLDPAGVTPRRVTQIQLTEGIVELVRSRVGISALARWAIAPYLRDGSLRAVRLTRTGFSRQWVGVMLAQDPMPSYLSAFVNQLAVFAPGLVAA
jgi:LysR family transcriptional regulator, regulator for metE and metH